VQVDFGFNGDADGRIRHDGHINAKCKKSECKMQSSEQEMSRLIDSVVHFALSIVHFRALPLGRAGLVRRRHDRLNAAPH
jgi:hypothetical protein